MFGLLIDLAGKAVGTCLQGAADIAQQVASPFINYFSADAKAQRKERKALRQEAKRLKEESKNKKSPTALSMENRYKNKDPKKKADMPLTAFEESNQFQD